jgi:hypothetical protein
MQPRVTDIRRRGTPEVWSFAGGRPPRSKITGLDWRRVQAPAPGSVRPAIFRKDLRVRRTLPDLNSPAPAIYT